ncbi:MAG: hypothetical protein ABSB87_21095 [Terriglobales bacterium]|jgi:hypothetical protein
MLAGVRSCFLLFFVVAFSVAAFLPVQAQVNGVAPSVTSMGFGGRAINGVPPSVTSIGFGNNWSVYGNTNFLFPANPNPARDSGRHHRRHRNDGPLVGVIEPAYAPYATDPNDDVADADLSKSSAPSSFAKPADDRDSAPQVDAQTEEPLAPQPSTVLVFKDGHQSDVLNYAIVGDTLFDFAAGRTHKILLADLDLKATQKANDDRGVDFWIPPTPIGQ